MTPADVDDAREILRGPLADTVLFGSFGLLLHGLRTPANVKDVDVIGALADVPAMGRALIERGFELRSWQDSLGADELTPARLAGRVYLRALRGGLVIDVTYEGLAVDEWRTDALLIDGITVATVERIERQRAHRLP